MRDEGRRQECVERGMKPNTQHSTRSQKDKLKNLMTKRSQDVITESITITTKRMNQITFFLRFFIDSTGFERMKKEPKKKKRILDL